MAEATSAHAGSASARPALVVATAILVLSAMDAVIKAFGPDSSVLQILWMRYLTGASVAAAVFFATGSHRIRMQSIRANGLRAIVMLVAAGSFFYAITRMPLVEAVTLSFIAPVLMVLIARALLGEPITARAGIGVGVGFLGVLVVVGGDLGAGQSLPTSGIVAALVSALAYALGIILLRKQAGNDAIPVLVFLQAAIAAAVMTPIGIATWTAIDGSALAAFAIIGLLGTCGHLLMAWGFKHAEAGRLAPLEYTNLLWATVFGVLFFSERPGPATLGGAVLIILACLIATRPGMPIFPRRRYVAPGD